MEKLRQKLMAAAKAATPSDRVPYAFEKRIMARLVAPLVVDVWAVWGRWLWRAVAPCMSVMVVLGAWVLVTMHPEPENQNLEQAIENTLLSSDDVAGE
ncbi:MAG: hypothetical protein HY300_10345 [Verrucomicrobia bacterium]|nr:hypothetical protein [Verrucomicrobiota bacterium]